MRPWGNDAQRRRRPEKYHARKGVVFYEEIAGLSRPKVEAILQRLGLAAAIRGEQLTLDQFAALADALIYRT